MDSIPIPSSLLQFNIQTIANVYSPSNARREMAKKLLFMIRAGVKNIPITNDNKPLINWIQSPAKNNTLNIVWYLKEADRENPMERPRPSRKLDVWEKH